jgi:hypothetical protein
MPDYQECYKHLTNNTNAISVDDLTVYNEKKLTNLYL